MKTSTRKKTRTALCAAVVASLALAGCAKHAVTPAPAGATLPPTPLHIVSSTVDRPVHVAQAEVIGVDPATTSQPRSTVAARVQVVTLRLDSDSGIGTVLAIEQPATLAFVPGERVEVFDFDSDGFRAVEPLPTLPKPPPAASPRGK